MHTTSYHMNRQGDRSGSPNKRWQTTARSAAEDVASQLQGSYDRASMVKGLTERKMANTKTSISFGNEKVNYVSDTHENLLRCSGKVSAEERNEQMTRIKQMKADLTTTNFTLGDEIPSYNTVNHDAMAVAESFRGVQRVAMNNDIKEAVKKSSINFGNEKINYESVAHSAMHYRGNENNFSKLKEEVQSMTKQLRKHNFTLGDEKVDYETDYNRGYGSLPKESYAQRHLNKGNMQSVIEDSRKCHFILGNDRPQYLSNTHAALKNIEGHSPTDVFQQMERAKEMKQNLQKTSIVIGDDKEYF